MSLPRIRIAVTLVVGLAVPCIGSLWLMRTPDVMSASTYALVATALLAGGTIALATQAKASRYAPRTHRGCQ